MEKVRHVLGISGGKDSAALAIYLRQKHPELDIDYYFCDTGRELEETYLLIDKLETVLNKPIYKLPTVENSPTESPFDHFLQTYGGYLPSSQSRWCTRKLKLEPFEKYLGDDPVISYVGIRGDENREAYISRKPNVQSIFPFRRNIWSKDVIAKVLQNSNTDHLYKLCSEYADPGISKVLFDILKRPVTNNFTIDDKANALLEVSIPVFNQVVMEFLKTTKYPIGMLSDYSLASNTDILVKDDIFRILEESGVGIPSYYKPIEFEVDGKKGYYSRTRSGCFFCFFQQKIEWVWLLEQHPELFEKALEYEKEGYTWMAGETLEELREPQRIRQIKLDQHARIDRLKNKKSNKLLDILDDDHEEGCAACFI